MTTRRRSRLGRSRGGVTTAPIPRRVIAFLIYRDAKRRNSDHAIAWGLGAFFGSLVVWILYYVVRDEVGSGSAA